jgi:hypothetical protein
MLRASRLEAGMGLIEKFGQMRMKDPVEGTLTVTGVNTPDPTATSQNYRIDGVVSAPDFAAVAVTHHGIASLSKWPQPGDPLPITFDRMKPERLVVHWDGLATGREQAQSAAQALAEQMRLGATAPPMPAAPMPAAPMPAPPMVSAADILARGLRGTATIKTVLPSAEVAQKPAHTMVGLELDVTIPGRAPYEVKNLYGVPNAKLEAVSVGTTLPVAVDPVTAGMVAIDWEAVTLVL